MYTGLAAFSTTINIALPPSASFSSLYVLFQLSVACSWFLARPNLCATRSLLPRVPRPSFEPFGLAVAEGREGRAGLKPESSISYSRFDAPKKSATAIIPLSHVALSEIRACAGLTHPLLCCRTITTLMTMLIGDYECRLCLGSASMRCI